MNKKLIIIALLCACVTPICRAQSPKTENASLLGEWVFEKAEILVKQKGSQNYVLESEIANTEAMMAFSFCYGQGVKNIRFDTEERIDVDCLLQQMWQSAYQLFDEADGFRRLEITWYPLMDEYPENQQAINLYYYLSMPDEQTLVVVHEVICGSSLENMKDSRMLTYLKRLENK